MVEALAFNNVCRALDLSKNGIGGGLGAAALCQVRRGAERERGGAVPGGGSEGEGGAQSNGACCRVVMGGGWVE